MSVIEYYFDFLSPYSYLSWHWVRRNQQYQFDFIPVVLSRVIHRHKTKGPAEIKPKRNYLMKDCLRYAHQNELPLTIPKQLPFNSLEALRIAQIAGDKKFEVIDTLFLAAWAKGLDISDNQVLEDLGLGVFLEESGSIAARKGLKENQKRAEKRDLFGLPSFVISDELFWGNDSICHLEAFLKGDDFFDKKVYKQFLDIGNFSEE